jgi:hypothetical protein
VADGNGYIFVQESRAGMDVGSACAIGGADRRYEREFKVCNGKKIVILHGLKETENQCTTDF